MTDASYGTGGNYGKNETCEPQSSLLIESASEHNCLISWTARNYQSHSALEPGSQHLKTAYESGRKIPERTQVTISESVSSSYDLLIMIIQTNRSNSCRNVIRVTGGEDPTTIPFHITLVAL